MIALSIGKGWKVGKVNSKVCSGRQLCNIHQKLKMNTSFNSTVLLLVLFVS